MSTSSIIPPDILKFDPNSSYKLHVNPGKKKINNPNMFKIKCEKCQQFSLTVLNNFATFFCAKYAYIKAIYIAKNSNQWIEVNEAIQDSTVFQATYNDSYTFIKTQYAAAYIFALQGFFKNHIFEGKIPVELEKFKEILDINPKEICDKCVEAVGGNNHFGLSKSINQGPLKLFAEFYCAMLSFAKDCCVYKNMRPEDKEYKQSWVEFKNSFSKLETLSVEEIESYRERFEKLIFKNIFPLELKKITDDLLNQAIFEIDQNRQSSLKNVIQSFKPRDIYASYIKTDPSQNNNCESGSTFDKKRLELFADAFCALLSYAKASFLHKDTEYLINLWQEFKQYFSKLDSWQIEEIETFVNLFINHIFKNQIPKELEKIVIDSLNYEPTEGEEYEPTEGEEIDLRNKASL